MPDHSPDALRDLARQAAARLREAGFTAYWAGGCVRDTLLGRLPKDYDIATDARPERVLELFPDSVEVGKAFGVVRVRCGEAVFEVATFRTDHSYSDGRRPESIAFSNPQEDARRRDFTINAMFIDPAEDRLLDYVGGKADLDARVVRCVGDPAERFAEDHLRMLRAVRFSTVLQFALDPATASAIASHANLIPRISAERTRDELTRILTESQHIGDAVLLLDKVDLLGRILPEIVAMKGVQQPPAYHPEGDVFTHTIVMLNLAANPSPDLAFAILFHDAGKPGTATESDGRIRFNGHAALGAQIALNALSRLRFPGDQADAIADCVRNHMHFLNVREMRDSTLRRLIGRKTFDTELDLHRLDCIASHGDLSNWNFLCEARDRFAGEECLPQAIITGHDIMNLGVQPGPEVGLWKTRAYDAQMEDKFREREQALEWLRSEFARSRSSDAP